MARWPLLISCALLFATAAACGLRIDETQESDAELFCRQAGFGLGSQAYADCVDSQNRDAIALGPDRLNTCESLTRDQRLQLIATHVVGGLPSKKELRVRRGYVIDYDADNRVPRWVSYRFEPGFEPTPPREEKFASLYPDPSLTNTATGEDYAAPATEDAVFVPGLLAPYFIMGGDRDGDGQLAVDLAQPGSLDVVDDYDACTLFEANYLSNVVPWQLEGPYGTAGLWSEAQGWLRGRIADAGSGWVIAGPLYGGPAKQEIKPGSGIYVPHAYYMIVVAEGWSEARPKLLAFVFPHSNDLLGQTECVKDAAIENCLVALAAVEKISGLEFFPDVAFGDEAKFKETDTFVYWFNFFQSSGP